MKVENQTFVYATETPVVHLIRTVEYHHELPQRFAHVLNVG